MAQADAAIAAFEKYQQARSRTPSTAGSDVEELINRAKAKKAVLEANAAAAQPAAAPSSSAPAAAGSATPAPAASGAQ